MESWQINLSISTNSFPDHWQIAKVTPLHNGGARNDSNNYRPISVLPILSKILEKHVASSLPVFLRHNNLLYDQQSAFRTGHSTETALIRLTDQILKNMDNDEVTGLAFIDCRKAFDVLLMWGSFKIVVHLRCYPFFCCLVKILLVWEEADYFVRKNYV